MLHFFCFKRTLNNRNYRREYGGVELVAVVVAVAVAVVAVAVLPSSSS